jgi:hypothetical protein
MEKNELLIGQRVWVTTPENKFLPFRCSLCENWFNFCLRKNSFETHEQGFSTSLAVHYSVRCFKEFGR